MRHRFWRILLTCFTAVWFGVLVPGHPRGAIPIPGDSAARLAGCCAVPRGDASCHSGKQGKSAPPPARPWQSCAVCQFIAALDMPPPLVMDAPPMFAAPILEPTSFSQFIPSRVQLAAVQERGPPAM